MIFLFILVCFVVFLGFSSSPEESESVASWSVRMTRRSFRCGGWGFPVVLRGGSASKFEIGGCGLMGWNLKGWCVSLILVKKSEEMIKGGNFSSMKEWEIGS